VKNVKIAAVMIFVISLVGCRPNLVTNNSPEQKVPNAKKLVQDLVYIKDEKSGLCFAYAWHSGSYDNYGGPVFTNVPCEKVEKLLINNK
jgi:hypothetical protein